MVAERLIEAGCGPRKQAIKRGEYPSILVAAYPNEDTILDLLFAEISRYPLLSAKRVWACFHRIALFKHLTPDTDAAILERNRLKAAKARERLINSNRRLAVSTAFELRYHGDMSILDVISEAEIGLILAIDSFDYQRGYKFSTYAVPVIRDQVIKAVRSQGEPIRRPQYSHELGTTVRRFTDKYEQEFGKLPSPEQIEATMRAARPIKYAEIDYSRAVGDVLFHGRLTIVSLDEPVGNSDTPIAEIVPSSFRPSEAAALENVQREELYRLMKEAGLTEYQIQVMFLVYGLNNNNNPQKYTEVGEKLGKTRQAIYATVQEAVRKLKKSEAVLDYLRTQS